VSSLALRLGMTSCAQDASLHGTTRELRRKNCGTNGGDRGPGWEALTAEGRIKGSEPLKTAFQGL